MACISLYVHSVFAFGIPNSIVFWKLKWPQFYYYLPACVEKGTLIQIDELKLLVISSLMGHIWKTFSYFPLHWGMFVSFLQKWKCHPLLQATLFSVKSGGRIHGFVTFVTIKLLCSSTGQLLKYSKNTIGSTNLQENKNGTYIFLMILVHEFFFLSVAP